MPQNTEQSYTTAHTAQPTLPIARVGDHLPDIALPRFDGSELALRDLRGRRLLLFFWGSW